MKNWIYILFAGLLAVGCDDYLDVPTDTRTQLDTPEKIRELMVTSYPTANYAIITEFGTDNIIDNRVPINGFFLADGAFDRMDQEVFEWDDVKSANEQDSPYSVWEEFYQSIAAANHVLEAIETLKAEGNTENMDAQKGEALMLRAYSHFILVNIFGKTYKDPTASAKDLGVTYMTEPEKHVIMQYERNSVAEVYDLIAKDIEEGLPLIDDASYTQKSYHFSKSAANAFASQFYLYKRDYAKAVEHANAVLGTGDPTSLLRNWKNTYSNIITEGSVYISGDEPANLLLIPTSSIYMRRFWPHRYGWNGTGRSGVTDSGPNWSGALPSFQGWIWTAGQNYGAFHAKVYEQFEYTDKVAGIGYPHIVRTEFTTDDVLLNRAEAKIMLGQIDDAVKDLQYWTASHKVTSPLTRKAITDFYKEGRQYYVFEFHNTELSSQFVITAEQKPFIDCVLHFRRMERVLEGHRWFDLKRYGIEITHTIGIQAEKRTLTYDDDRRAIQIPSDVVGAGLEPNPREVNPIDNSDLKQLEL
ncbi:MAG: RagB/SusD family nutrient uptake outer membrane protein [Dysgonamonadaceae bacterium]|nr:RagB/SusD family nutrient uptake outer membrane protein [Dysgonamonadaceae bacterium]